MMRSRYLFLCAIAAMAANGLMATDAKAGAFRKANKPVPSWYIGLAGSVNFVSDTELDDGTRDGDIEFDEGYGIHGALGYRPRHTNSLFDYMRFEAELAVRDNEMDQFVQASGVTNLTDDFQVQTAMVNAYFDIPVSESWRPYLGAGIGAARFHFESTGLTIDDEDTVLAWQGMVGLSYTPPNFRIMDIGVGYRYLGTEEASLTNAAGGSAEVDYESHSLEIGTRFYF